MLRSHGLTRLQVVFSAYYQYAESKELGRVIRKALGQPEWQGCIRRACLMVESTYQRVWRAMTKHIHMTQPMATNDSASAISTGSPHHPWTMTHSMYAVMGGFAIDTSNAETEYLPNGRQSMTLTTKGLEFVAKYDPGLLSNTPESEIQDKSKANAFTKALAYTQAISFCTQVLARLPHGLATPLLEMNTAVQALCALLLYLMFWLNKPLDVDITTPCSSENLHLLSAITAARFASPQSIWNFSNTRLFSGSPTDMTFPELPGVSLALPFVILTSSPPSIFRTPRLLA